MKLIKPKINIRWKCRKDRGEKGEVVEEGDVVVRVMVVVAVAVEEEEDNIDQ